MKRGERGLGSAPAEQDLDGQPVGEGDECVRLVFDIDVGGEGPLR